MARLRSLASLGLPATVGAISALGFAPLQWWPLQLLSLAYLFHAISQAQARVFRIAWAWGFGAILAGVYWLFTARHRFGDIPAPLALIALIILALFIGSFTGLAMWCAQRLRQAAPDYVFLLLILPACWSLNEWIRGFIFTGFPWVVSGYAHTDSPLAGFAPLLGVYGLGWLSGLAAGLMVLAYQRKIATHTPIIGLVALFGSGWGLQTIAWTTPQGAPITVRLLQGNISQDLKFARERVIDSLQLYQRLIVQEPADLIAIPETAFPIFAHLLPNDFFPGLQDFAQRSQSHLILGVPFADGQERYTNSALGISARAGVPHYRYDKHHLVPFGEVIPPGFRWFVDMMRIPLGDFTPGAALQAPFAVKDQWVLPNICYEDLFGEEIAAQLGQSNANGQPVASILLNISNLAWFGQSTAIPQHLQISRMRTLETGRPMLRSTNTGATAIISAKAEVLHLLPSDMPGVLRGEVQGYSGTTPYMHWRNLLFLGLSLGSLLLAFILARRIRQDRT